MSEQIDLFKVTEVELVYRNKSNVIDRPKVTDPDAAYEVFKQNWRSGSLGLMESFYVLLLDNAKGAKGMVEISRGGSTATIVDPQMVYVAAIKAAANSIVVAHNHPSGNLKESQADIRLTKRLVEAGRFLGIPLDDHLILTPNGYLSFHSKGLLNRPG